MRDDWGQLEGENHCDFIERLHQKWEGLEQKTHDELLELKDGLVPTSIGDDGEVTHVDFVWRHRNVHCETFREIDFDDLQDPFKSSEILRNFDKKMADYDKSMFEDMKIRAELAPYLVANHATEKKLGSTEEIKKLIAKAYEQMDSLKRNEWKVKITDGKRVLNGETVDSYIKNKEQYKKRYAAVTDVWESWGSGRREWTKDKKMNNDRNLYASNPENAVLRRPSSNGDIKAIYIAFDKNGKIIVFLDPQGIPWSYDEKIHQLMKTDSHEFYSVTKKPNPKGNGRHISQGVHLKDNPAIMSWWCGSDHYGHWHAEGHTHYPILETGDVKDLNATQRQLLLQFLKYTGGPMTRVLDFWFGVWQPELRKRYRNIYAKSPEFARLPPVNEDHPETYCLRVSVCNRPTDEHRDQSDMKGGLTGLVQLGDFQGTLSDLEGTKCISVPVIDVSTGAAMCFNQLGIALDGYGDGAVLLFRGTETKHYISQWSGNYRYAFDHTTHQSVEDAITTHDETGRWGPKKDPQAPKAPKAPKGGKESEKPDDDEDDGKPDGGDASGKSQGKTKKRERDDDEDENDGAPAPKKRKEETREPPRDEDEEQPAENPAPTKRGGAGATKGARQIRAAKGKSNQIKEEQSGTQLPARGSRRGAQNSPQKAKGK